MAESLALLLLQAMAFVLCSPLIGHCSLERQSSRVLLASEQHYCIGYSLLALSFPLTFVVLGITPRASCNDRNIPTTELHHSPYLLNTAFLRVLVPLPLFAPLHAPLKVLFFSMATALGSSKTSFLHLPHPLHHPWVTGTVVVLHFLLRSILSRLLHPYWCY